MKQEIPRTLSVTLIVVGATLLIIGLMRQEQLTVLKKAIVICLECIGLG